MKGRLASLHPEEPSRPVGLSPRPDLQPAHGGDARQGLSSETEKADALELLQRADLAGGMPRHGQRKIVEGDALTVVLHHDPNLPPLGEGNPDVLRPRVEGVLHGLLHHGQRAFHHFSRGDAREDGLRKRVYFQSEAPPCFFRAACRGVPGP